MVAVSRPFTRSVPGSGLSSRIVSTRKPIPTSSSAPPIAITNVATLSAKYAVFSAVWNAVEEIQMLRAGFSTGSPVLASLAAAASSSVDLPDSSRKRPIWL